MKTSSRSVDGRQHLDDQQRLGDDPATIAVEGLAADRQIGFKMIATADPHRSNPGLRTDRALGTVERSEAVDFAGKPAGDDLVRDRRRRHRDDDAVEQLVMALVVRTGVEELLDRQQFVGRLHASI